MKARVLIVEDNESLLSSLVDALEMYTNEMEVVGFTTAEDALDHHINNPADVIITDIRLPGMDGLTFLLQARKLQRKIRFIVMTAYGDDKIREIAKRWGAVAYIEKPFDIDEFVQKVRTVVTSGPTFRARNLSGITLIDVLQILHMSKRSSMLIVNNMFNEWGRIYIREGEIIHAETQYQGGLEALREILSWDSGEFETVVLPKNVPQTISETLPNLLLTTMQAIDEAMRDALSKITNTDMDTVEQLLRNNIIKLEHADAPELRNSVKEVSVMVSQAKIEQVLDTLRDVEGSFGSVLVADDGMIIASRLDKRFAADKIAALASDLVTALKRVITELQFGEPKTLLVEGDQGKVSIIEAPGGGMFIMLIGSSDMNLGMARMALSEAMEQIT